ncbi:hypothetical protein LOTGIDRAFT_161415 [Lottia gigantea]|uniref:Uncharacterized protein n=1 Tax=Lottia gigantea TaxID=225164 RepID=V4ABL3_LOTGI|nr:hypothetical protein LOTGIDRAFT_161415 [Lottia gigantea]ESO94207.1 hypothetical protein LOTGIDRAFT_161415 [Lottia gigantea]
MNRVKASTYKNISIGDICGVDKGVNRICVDSHTVCSEVSNGARKCLCDRNYGKIGGQCERVPNTLFMKSFVNETISPGDNITIDYNITTPMNNLTAIQIVTIPDMTGNVEYIYSVQGISVMIYNTGNLKLETFMIRLRAEYGGVKVQDSTLIHLHTIEPDIEDYNVILGDKCGLDEGFNKICVNSNAVCSQGLDGIMSCVCDRNYTNIDGQCENVPNKLFMKDFVNETITQGENITIDYELTVPTITLNNIQIDTIPNISNFKYDSSNGELKVWIFNTQNLSLENFMIRMRAVYGDVEVQDSTLNFMIRMRAVYGDVEVQDSTLVYIHIMEPDIEDSSNYSNTYQFFKRHRWPIPSVRQHFF